MFLGLLVRQVPNILNYHHRKSKLGYSLKSFFSSSTSNALSILIQIKYSNPMVKYILIAPGQFARIDLRLYSVSCIIWFDMFTRCISAFLLKDFSCMFKSERNNTLITVYIVLSESELNHNNPENDGDMKMTKLDCLNAFIILVLASIPSMEVEVGGNFLIIFLVLK